MRTSLGIALIFIFLASIGSAQSGADDRVWTAKSGKQVTAKLTSHDGAVVNLKCPDGSKRRIMESELSSVDRAYLIKYSRGKQIASVTLSRSEKLAIETEAIKASTDILLKELAVETARCLKSNPEQGSHGYIMYRSAHIDQIINSTTALVTYRWGLPGNISSRQVMLQGLDVTGLADDMTLSMQKEYIIDGTTSYDTASGSKRTVLIMRPYTQASTNAPPL
jgi:hypothetical protein